MKDNIFLVVALCFLSVHVFVWLHYRRPNEQEKVALNSTREDEILFFFGRVIITD